MCGDADEVCGRTCPCKASLLASSDPLSMGPQKALETIGANLQKQYENWQPRVRLCASFLGGMAPPGLKQPLNPGESCGRRRHAVARLAPRCTPPARPALASVLLISLKSVPCRMSSWCALRTGK